MKVFATLALLFVSASATNECTEPKEVLFLSNTQLMDRQFIVGDNGKGNYCVELGGDANLFVRKYNGNRRLGEVVEGDRSLTNNKKCDGEKIWKSECRCDVDGGVDYWMRFQKDGNLLVRYDNPTGPYIFKSNTHQQACHNSNNHRELTECPKNFAFVVSCDEGVAIWSLDNNNNPKEMLWKRGKHQHGGGRCKMHNCPSM